MTKSRGEIIMEVFQNVEYRILMEMEMVRRAGGTTQQIKLRGRSTAASLRHSLEEVLREITEDYTLTVTVTTANHI